MCKYRCLSFRKRYLKNNPEADIFQWENVVYANAESAGWLEEEDFSRGEQIGEVQRTSKNPYRFQDGTASQLETGSAVYRSENGDNHLTVDTEEGVVVYIGLVEEG